MSAHTPGPWRIGKAGAIVANCPPSCSGVEHEDFYGGHFICESVSGPDARLIAAAPDLLEAARQAVWTIRELTDYAAEFEPSELLAAIAKVEGR